MAGTDTVTIITGEKQRLNDAEERPHPGPFLFCFIAAMHNRTRTLVCERLKLRLTTLFVAHW